MARAFQIKPKLPHLAKLFQSNLHFFFFFFNWSFSQYSIIIFFSYLEFLFIFITHTCRGVRVKWRQSMAHWNNAFYCSMIPCSTENSWLWPCALSARALSHFATHFACLQNVLARKNFSWCAKKVLAPKNTAPSRPCRR